MARRPRYPHPDANQSDIIRALEECGFLVLDVSRILATPDIFVWGHHIDGPVCWTAWEIKTDTGTLTDEQQTFMDAHPGAVQIARHVEDVLDAYGR